MPDLTAQDILDARDAVYECGSIPHYWEPTEEGLEFLIELHERYCLWAGPLGFE